MKTNAAIQTAEFTRPGATQIQDAIHDLKTLLGERATTAEVIREHHSHGESYHPAALPDVVCFPQSTEEVSAIVKISAKYGVPMIPFGGGTSMEAQVNAISRRHHARHARDEQDREHQRRGSAGDGRSGRDAHAAESGRWRIPASHFSSIRARTRRSAGMASTRASGTTAVRYGTMRENVLALKVVLADGRVIKTGSRARKSAAGYDLTQLFVGAEGTLGVITEVTLRLHPLPEAVGAASCTFATIRDAIETAIETIQLGIAVARIEFMDEVQVEACNRYSKTNYPVAPILFFEFHGDSVRNVDEQAETVKKLAEEHQRARISVVHHAGRARNSSGKCGTRRISRTWRFARARKMFTTDICVPISRLADCIVESKKDMATRIFPGSDCGARGRRQLSHVVHDRPRTIPPNWPRRKSLEEKMILRALEMGGTCTGEHGIGTGRKKYLPIEHGPALDVMRAIKQTLDPDNRMNPGKMVEPRALW